ncbi:hypothetical protein SLG_21620 [Sphingobium sp. SYK-6]|uniref:DUF551 domain-containing protein n=1 Tax=Sphingobium sp. (strain NBRC 103272 / SYK-6) TaxID=627192 RepID=UPI000227709D|nr:DUF551 domain-containing protein [Sphingobium sp. SYK-6]BAK66837.1 hypothetical protein SLG_21620 [Sphingobium sp. SYK-6]
MGWQPIETLPDMLAVWLHHPYYSHGQGRHGYRGKDGNWRGVNADGTEGPLRFEPTHWMPLPIPPEEQRG